MYNVTHTHPSVFGLILDHKVKMFEFFLMLILGLRLEIFYFSSYGYCETSLFQCHFISFVDKVTELFQGGLDNKRNVSFSCTPGNICPQAVTLNSVT